MGRGDVTAEPHPTIKQCTVVSGEDVIDPRVVTALAAEPLIAETLIRRPNLEVYLVDPKTTAEEICGIVTECRDKVLPAKEK